MSIGNGTASVDGNASFIANVANASNNLNFDAIAAMAARRGGPDDGNTSEFSACIEYQAVDLFADGFEQVRSTSRNLPASVTPDLELLPCAHH